MISASLFILCLVGGVWAAAKGRLPDLGVFFATPSSEPVTYTISKTAFAVSVPASGELEAATATQISVPNVRTGGLKVFWIVKDGSLVKKGDTLVEFDASELLPAHRQIDLMRAPDRDMGSIFGGSAPEPVPDT